MDRIQIGKKEEGDSLCLKVRRRDRSKELVVGWEVEKVFGRCEVEEIGWFFERFRLEISENMGWNQVLKNLDVQVAYCKQL